MICVGAIVVPDGSTNLGAAGSEAGTAGGTHWLGTGLASGSGAAGGKGSELLGRWSLVALVTEVDTLKLEAAWVAEVGGGGAETSWATVGKITATGSGDTTELQLVSTGGALAGTPVPVEGDLSSLLGDGLAGTVDWWATTLNDLQLLVGLTNATELLVSGVVNVAATDNLSDGTVRESDSISDSLVSERNSHVLYAIIHYGRK